jgi:hypothetical protein
VDQQRLAVIPSMALEGAPVASLMYDEPLADPWTITVSGEAPADHQVVDPDWGLAMAWEIPLSYLDADDSGGLTEGDQPLYLVCLDGSTVVIFWADAARSVEQAWSYEYSWSTFGGRPGLFAVAMDPDAADGDPPIQIDPVDLLSLELSGACTLE